MVRPWEAPARAWRRHRGAHRLAIKAALFCSQIKQELRYLTNVLMCFREQYKLYACLVLVSPVHVPFRSVLECPYRFVTALLHFPHSDAALI